MQPQNSEAPHAPFMDLVDLISEKMGGKVLFASDDFFAPKENLIKGTQPIFIPDKYTEFGKWMDGWESRRKRNLGPGNDHDWCYIKLAVPGVISGVDVDTAFFVGNFPDSCSLEACEAPSIATAKALEKAKWKTILERTKLKGGSHNLFSISDSSRFTHLRFNIFPDGGVARLHVYGEAKPELKNSKQPIDLAAALNGGWVVTCNNMFFGPKENLILPGRAKTMGDGWETQRKRGPGHDWIVVRLGHTGTIQKIEVDTNHFKGNFPESCSIEGLSYSGRDLTSDYIHRGSLSWKEILPRTKLKAHTRHYFIKELKSLKDSYDYVRLNIYPDGGISRLRVWGNLK